MAPENIIITPALNPKFFPVWRDSSAFELHPTFWVTFPHRLVKKTQHSHPAWEPGDVSVKDHSMHPNQGLNLQSRHVS